MILTDNGNLQMLSTSTKCHQEFEAIRRTNPHNHLQEGYCNASMPHNILVSNEWMFLGSHQMTRDHLEMNSCELTLAPVS